MVGVPKENEMHTAQWPVDSPHKRRQMLFCILKDQVMLM
jgi:hypothetical protein